MPCLINKSYNESFIQDYLLEKLTGSTEEGWIDTEVNRIKVDPNSFVGSFTYRGKSYYLKAYHVKGLLGRFINGLGLSRPFRQWKKINGFCKEIESPEPIIVLTSPDLSTAYYATDFIEDSRDLNKCLVGDGKLVDEQARKILFSCGLLLGRVHQQGWFHGDLKWSNLLVDKNGNISIIDLDGLKRMPLINRSLAKGKDLARFILNAEEFLENGKLLECFLKGYCKQRDLSRNICIKEFYPYLLALRIKHRKKYGVRGKHFF